MGCRRLYPNYRQSHPAIKLGHCEISAKGGARRGLVRAPSIPGTASFPLGPLGDALATMILKSHGALTLIKVAKFRGSGA
jgi:hypothetical protein